MPDGRLILRDQWWGTAARPYERVSQIELFVMDGRLMAYLGYHGERTRAFWISICLIAEPDQDDPALDQLRVAMMRAVRFQGDRDKTFYTMAWACPD